MSAVAAGVAGCSTRVTRRSVEMRVLNLPATAPIGKRNMFRWASDILNPGKRHRRMWLAASWTADNSAGGGEPAGRYRRLTNALSRTIHRRGQSAALVIPIRGVTAICSSGSGAPSWIVRPDLASDNPSCAPVIPNA